MGRIQFDAWPGPRCLILVLAFALATSEGSRIIYLQSGDGQGFADAVALFGGTGTDMTFVLPPGRLSLHNVTFKDAVPVGAWEQRGTWQAELVSGQLSSLVLVLGCGSTGCCAAVVAITLLECLDICAHTRKRRLPPFQRWHSDHRGCHAHGERRPHHLGCRHAIWHHICR